MSRQQRQRAGVEVWRFETALTEALWDGLAAEWASVAARRYPDGSPYLAEQHLANLARVAAEVEASGWPEADSVTGHLTTLMVGVRDADKRPRSREDTRALLAACTSLVAHGLVREAGFVAAAGVDVSRFHEQRAG